MGKGGKLLRFCSKRCKGQVIRGERHGNWKGGFHVPANPKSYAVRLVETGKQVREHRLVAEAALGRRLPEKAVVHHADGNSLNNKPSNLVICENIAYHRLLHARERRLKECGSLDLKKCSLCGQVKPLSDFNAAPRWDGRHGYCKLCHSQYDYNRNHGISASAT